MGKSRKALKYVTDFLDRWAVQERPPHLVGAVLGILMLVGIAVYAAVLAGQLLGAPPREANKQQATAKRLYTINIGCVTLATQPRDANGG